MLNKEEMKRALGPASVFEIGGINSFGQYFDGTSYLQMLTTTGVSVEMWSLNRAAGITGTGMFMGARSFCAREAGAIIRNGEKPARELLPGDVVQIGEEKHWHGAAPNSWFSHLAIDVPGEGSKTEWLEPVDPEEYNKLP